jgi:aldehyde:ferredoxin oxidoreductase
MYGYHGKILRVDLSDEKIWVENQEDRFYRRYLGGWGFIAYYLLTELGASIDPLTSGNKLVIAPGPITGVPIAGSGRNAVGGKSPLTDGFGASEGGGFFGAELKRAGFDCMVVDGEAEHPVYLWIHDSEAEIRDAKHLWGLHIADSQHVIREELGDQLVRTSQIGPGGENLVRYACVINDLKHAAGRVGLGSVMGSKKLKAVAVRGHKRVEVADPEKIQAMAKEMSDRMGTKPKGGGGVDWGLGTGSWMTAHVLSGNLPTRNFRDGLFTNPEAISAQTIRDTVGVRIEACYACCRPCKKVVKVDEPWVVDPIYGGPEYETLAALGSNCGIDDLKAVCKANELCQRYTLDTIATGATIAFAMECFENGVLTEEDTDGMKLSFGNAEALVKTVELIGERKGIGDLLAEGTKRAAEKIGMDAEKYAVHVKGQEVPMHEPRLKRALGLGYAISPTGADHVHNIHDTGFITQSAWEGVRPLGILDPVPVDDLGPNKVRLLIYNVYWAVLNNCYVLCGFLPWSYDQKLAILKAVTGWNTTTWELMKTSERVINMARLFNVREGLSAKDDWLPDRFFHPQTVGPLSEVAVDPEKLEEAKRTYYRMMCWDEDTGIPSKGKLEELGISWVAKEINR